MSTKHTMKLQLAQDEGCRYVTYETINMENDLNFTLRQVQGR